ncbi:MAG: phage head-tail connector protein [Thermotogaceae bacterium]|nr:phage head-tail connector protein [Thermotogaceae bacterium]
MVTLAELKNHLAIQDDKHDLRLNALLRGAIAFVKSYCGRQFTYGTYIEQVEFVNGVGFINESPIDEVVSVIDSMNNTYTVWYTTNLCMIKLDAKATDILTVTYKGGYTAIPEDLKLGVMQYAEYMWNKPAGVHGTGEAELRTYYEGFDTSLLDMYRVVKI